MSKFKILFSALVLSTLLLALHLWGMSSDLYVKYWFYDVILHILGGASVALAIYSIGVVFDLAWLKRFTIVVLLSLVAGIAWEVFEVYFDITGFHVGTRDYNMDTLKDLFNDTLGAIALMLIVRK